MKLLSISGAATRIVGQLSALETLLAKGFMPDILCGSSAGAILSACYGMGVLPEAKKLIMRMDMKTIFGSWWNYPSNKRGSFLSLGAIWRVVTGKNYLGIMKGLESNLKSIITEEVFFRYVLNVSSPDIYIGAINASSLEVEVWSLKHIDYQTAIKVIIASSSIACMVNPVAIDNDYYYDCGHREHSLGNWFLINREESVKLTEMVTIWGRSKQDILTPSFLWKKGLVATIIHFILRAFSYETTKNDEMEEYFYTEKIGINYQPVFVTTYSNSTFDTSEKTKQINYQSGIKAVEEQYIINNKIITE